MKRPRNADCGKIRRPLKRNKITDGIYGRYVFTFSIWQFIAYFTKSVKNLQNHCQLQAILPTRKHDVHDWKLENQFFAWLVYLREFRGIQENASGFCYVGMVSAFKSLGRRENGSPCLELKQTRLSVSEIRVREDVLIAQVRCLIVEY